MLFTFSEGTLVVPRHFSRPASIKEMQIRGPESGHRHGLGMLALALVENLVSSQWFQLAYIP